MTQVQADNHFPRAALAFLSIASIVVAFVLLGSLLQTPVVASHLNYNVHLRINGLDTNGWTVSPCPTTYANGTGPWVCSIASNGVVENNTLTFRTGQVVKVDLWFEYLKKPVDPATVHIQSASVGSGFQVLDRQPSLPLSLTGWGSQGGLVLYLRVLPGNHSGRVLASVWLTS